MATKHTFTIGNNTPVTKDLTYRTAIRAKCMECSNGSSNEIKFCTVKLCPLYPFRFGSDPGMKKRVLTETQKTALAERLRKARYAKNHTDADRV